LRNIRLALEYEGTNYSGWQIQKNAVTIQGLVQNALSKITQESIGVVGASRTDAGVHALEQIASFTTHSHLTPHVIKKALNALLPEDIRVWEALEVPHSFNPRFEAKKKSYSYFITASEKIPFLLRRYVWNIPYLPPLEPMTHAAHMLVGQHDFSSFQASGCTAHSAVRTLESISVSYVPSFEYMTVRCHVPLIKITVQGMSFLRYMVRNIVGTLVETGQGRFNPNDVRDILHKKDRRLAGQTAPASGLFLEKIIF
jgi:tRNA pseudouridine38-40 synthase